MRRSSLTALAWLFFANALAAQQRDSATNPVPNQTVYVEIGGNAGLLSMNYDRKLNERFTARIGYGKWATFRSFPAGDQENDYGRFVPVMINFLSRSAPGSRNWIEVGAGMVFGEWWSEVSRTLTIASARHCRLWLQADGATQHRTSGRRSHVATRS